ncbi:hypothetical protein BN873_270027 [Candidatus Competibacter denitrificans Run_A_D11]|uniref:Uncharacterized protein n=1 Tax=Candidatus Competibacter denitrificans Run_A_D11 TaxID=1400863 RepID=W6M3G5_9GAMM|nr:hypothetical protein BN873_270027 [Candidatus Competibacter denitrificans Run_A_D11]
MVQEVARRELRVMGRNVAETARGRKPT